MSGRLTTLRVTLIGAGAFVFLVLALWLSGGVLAVIGPGVDSARVGILPPFSRFPYVLFAAACIVVILRPTGAAATTLLVTALAVVPWLPLPVPAPFLIWTGHAGAALCVAAVLTLLLVHTTIPRLVSGWQWWQSPRAAPTVAALVALVCYLVAGYRLAPLLPGGDEPHYLVMSQSLLLDGDLRIENNHQREDYHAYFPKELKPDYLRRGTDGQIYSIHAPGLAVLVAPAFALGGYRGVMVFLALIAALATALAWRLGWIVTGNPSAAWFGWAAVALSPPFLFHAFTAYPDGIASALVLVALVAFARLDREESGVSPVREAFRWLLVGSALAILPWLHSRFAILAAIAGGLLVWRLLESHTRRWRIGALMAMPVISAAAWFAFFKVIYGSFDPAAPYGGYTQTAVAHIATGLSGLLFDQQFGLIASAPVLALAVPGAWLLLRGSTPRHRHIGVAILGIVVPYLAIAGAYRMWWGGFSAPARFAVPVVLIAAAPLAVAWDRTSSAAGRWFAGSLLAISVGIAGVLAFGANGSLLYNARDGYALWLDWLNPIANLPGAAPSFLRESRWVALAQTLTWVAVGVIAWRGLHRLETRWPSFRDYTGVTALGVSAIAVMVGARLVCWIGGDQPLKVARSQVVLLQRYDAEPTARAVGYAPFRLTPAAVVPPRLEIPTDERGNTTTAATYSVPWLPAGDYRIVVRGRTPPALSVRIGRGPNPVMSLKPAGASNRTELVPLTLPVSVSGLAISGEGVPGRALTLRPTALLESNERVVDATAISGAQYGNVSVFTFDDSAYLEAKGLWALAGTDVRLGLIGGGDAVMVSINVRNGPVPNAVSLETAGGGEELKLQAEETVTSEMPVGRPISILHVRAKEGFRPKDVDATSGDGRLLGCWIEFPITEVQVIPDTIHGVPIPESLKRRRFNP